MARRDDRLQPDFGSSNFNDDNGDVSYSLDICISVYNYSVEF